MFSSNIRLVFYVIFLVFFLGISAKETTPKYLVHNCSNATTFEANGGYHYNLKQLLSFLISNTTSSSIGFYYTSVGEIPGIEVHGSFLCRGDISAHACKNCVTTAVKYSTEQLCPIEQVAVIWYDQCMLRYSNESFRGLMRDITIFALHNHTNVSNSRMFEQVVSNTMNDLVATATDDPTYGAKMFATKAVNFSEILTLYGLVECTPDLTSFDCDNCLQRQIDYLPICCGGKQGANVLSPSCSLRYEVYPFYNITATATIPRAQPSPPPTPFKGHKKKSSVIIVAIVVPIVIFVVLFSIGFKYLRRRSKKKYNFILQDRVEGEMTNIESLQYDFHTIEAATNNFSDDSKIGEGGFGVVYKGTLPNGEKIAAKRLLLGSSGQGANEFKNEAVLVAKLQHRNLVRLLGFCLEGEEKILIYEYAPNKSLDYYLFDHEKQRELDWERRYKIIGGIARGILYLHEDSRLKIIHRDLKAGNVLLDADMNPKVSDFGMAKVFVVDQTHGSSSRIVGTYGYMSPEYAMHGQFSIKSDVFSFGVLVLEILSGKKNNCFYQSHGSGDLLSFAWEHWRKGTPLELLDPSLGSSYSKNEVMKCIHIGLLCVQENPASRPTMATIVSMLDNYSITLPLPQQPTFFSRNREQTNTETPKSISSSVNDQSMITELHPR